MNLLVPTTALQVAYSDRAGTIQNTIAVIRVKISDDVHGYSITEQYIRCVAAWLGGSVIEEDRWRSSELLVPDQRHRKKDI